MVSQSKVMPGLAVAVLLGVPVWYFLRLHSQTPTLNERISHRMAVNLGLDEAFMHRMLDVSDKLGADKPISAEDWKVYETASRSSRLEYRVSALDNITHLEKTPYRDQAHSLMKRLAKDPEKFTRSIAMIDLWRTHDPDARKIVEAGLHDPSDVVRNDAKRLLAGELGGGRG